MKSNRGSLFLVGAFLAVALTLAALPVSAGVPAADQGSRARVLYKSVAIQGPAAAQVPEGDGYAAALVNFRYMANAVWTTDEAVQRMEGAVAGP